MHTQLAKHKIHLKCEVPYEHKSPSVERYTWATASGCIYVEELKVIGGGHDWPGVNGNMTIDADEEIWQFVSKYDINGFIECSTASINDTSKDTFRFTRIR